MTLGQFTRFPAKFRDREESINYVVLTNINYSVEEDKIVVTSQTESGYQQEIEILDNKISLRSPCKVYCDCESFKYEFSHAVFKQNSLLHPFKLLRSVISRPKIKNPYNIPSPCKHIARLAREALKIKLK